MGNTESNDNQQGESRGTKLSIDTNFYPNDERRSRGRRPPHTHTYGGNKIRKTYSEGDRPPLTVGRAERRAKAARKRREAPVDTPEIKLATEFYNQVDGDPPNDTEEITNDDSIALLNESKPGSPKKRQNLDSNGQTRSKKAKKKTTIEKVSVSQLEETQPNFQPISSPIRTPLLRRATPSQQVRPFHVHCEQ